MAAPCAVRQAPPISLYSGRPVSLPLRSHSAMSIAARAPVSAPSGPSLTSE
jgi:hypothetical protein